MTLQRILVWFRNDLRLHDNEVIHQALQTQAQIIPLYCFDPRQFSQTSYKFPKTGAYRAQFLRESLIDLRHSLQKLGSHLLVRQGKPENIIPELVKTLEISAVYYTEEVTFEEVKVEIALENVLRPLGVEIQSFWQTTLFHIDDLPFSMENLPEVFTQFRKEIEKKNIEIRQTFPTPQSLPQLQNIEAGEIPTLSDLGLETTQNDPRGVLNFQGGETAGIERVNTYFWQQDLLQNYKETRNGMLGADYSSKFSSWLANGSLSPRYIYEQVQEYEQQRVKNKSTYWLIFELMWRDYFRFICDKHGNQIFFESGLQGVKIPWQKNQDLWQKWQTGMTGYPLVDANMREIAATGFMSNRGRQNVASFLTKNLGINWQMGAEWFESLLIDYDVCSNWGNWNYTAGVGNDARGFRFFNIIKQSQDYDPNGEYVKHWLPELQALPPHLALQPWKMSQEEQNRYGVKLGEDYPKPIVDLFKSAKQNEKIYNKAIARSQS
ncbi:MAG: DASH family cryptochrome [Jaaginema sp. PMC 1079.18]|nr:DASH family cryptochrome [Jaaginema sp. PMC 1080.18]MEC4852749.1 DASH family cryptochrome [Jaaginema sp. PMC 1079.18]MEC4868330.1 DASH family cryptochrome [Jaaginema sp. PMC 1078.18]